MVGLIINSVTCYVLRVTCYVLRTMTSSSLKSKSLCQQITQISQIKSEEQLPMKLRKKVSIQ